MISWSSIFFAQHLTFPSLFLFLFTFSSVIISKVFPWFSNFRFQGQHPISIICRQQNWLYAFVFHPFNSILSIWIPNSVLLSISPSTSLSLHKSIYSCNSDQSHVPAMIMLVSVNHFDNDSSQRSRRQRRWEK